MKNNWEQLKKLIDDKIKETDDLIKKHEKDYHLKHSRLKYGIELSTLTWIKTHMEEIERSNINEK